MSFVKNVSQFILMFLCLIGARQLEYLLFHEIERVGRNEAMYIFIISAVTQLVVYIYRSKVH